MRQPSANVWKKLAIPAIFLFSLLVGWMVVSTTPFQTLELRITDALFRFRGPLELKDSPIVLVAISDQADEEIPEMWPWPRKYHAQLVHNLNAAGAKVIGFDVTFIQADEFNPLNDSLFAEAMQLYGNVVLAGDIRTERRIGRADVVRYLPPYRRFLENGQADWGIISYPLDPDGFVRRYQPQFNHMGQQYPSFALQLLRHYKDLEAFEVQETGRHFNLGFTRIPKFGRSGMLINYHGVANTFPVFSYEQIIDDSNTLMMSDREFFGMDDPGDKEYGVFDDPDFGLLHSGDLDGKIVIVGATMPELQDFHPTPFAAQFPGYEIHANVIQTILDGTYLRQTPFGILVLFTLFPLVLVVLITVYRGVVAGFVSLVFIAASIGAAVAFFFTHWNMRLELLLPVVPLFLGFLSSTTWRFVNDQIEKRRVQSLFGSYVSPELVRTMVDSGEEPRLGGEESHITAFFSDIQAFSTFSEQLEPRKLVDLINEYLSAMTDIITEENGTLDKYIGDAIVGFFGAPHPVSDHAYRACIASQRMILKQAELRERWKKEGDKWPAVVSQMQTRIGLNTGLMVTGNMGSSTRFNYTMMGDNVNLAARCESGAKSYGVFTLVTESTVSEALKFGDKCVFRYLDSTIVKGRARPVRLYEITGLRSHLHSGVFECLELFAEGVEHYQAQRWQQAMDSFLKSAELEPWQPGMPGVSSNPSLVMSERCRHLQKHPPGDDWDGVFIMKTK